MKKSTRREFFEKTTIHGIADLFLARSRSSRAFWFGTLLFCCGILVYSCVKMALDFSGSPMVTSVRTEHVNTFPNVLFCPLGTYLTEAAAEHYGITVDDYLTLNDFFYETHTVNSPPSFREWFRRVEDRFSDMQRLRQLLQRTNLTLEQLLQNLSNDVWIDAVYTTSDNVMSRVRLTDIAIVNSYGICFLVSVPAIARQGSFPAFLELTIPSFSKSLGVPGAISSLFTHGLLFMGDQAESFNPTMPTFVKDGKKNFLEIKETSMRYRSTRAAPCESEHGHEVADKAYTCYDGATNRIVNCTYLRTLKTPVETPVGSLEQHCHNVYHADKLNYTIDAFVECVTLHVDNQIPCVQKMYETAVVDVENPYNSTFIRLQYRYAVTLLIEEHEVYTWQVFFSNLGGIISLLCGASVISIAQLLFFIAKSSARTVRRTEAFNRARCRKATASQPVANGSIVGELCTGDCMV